MPNKAVQLVQLLRSSKREKRLGTVILFVIETGFAKRVAARRDEENDGAKTLFALAGTQELNKLYCFVWHYL